MPDMLRKQFVREITVQGNLHDVFACFCPVAERQWAPGWQCVMVYSQSGVAEKNCVFTTRHSPLPTMVWVCSIYDVDQEVEYVRVTPEHFVTSINILTTPIDNATRCVVTYTHTALSPGGAAFIEHHFTPEQFAADIDAWPAQIAAYLEHRANHG